jgi:hypothetical protein
LYRGKGLVDRGWGRLVDRSQHLYPICDKITTVINTIAFQNQFIKPSLLFDELKGKATGG